MYLDSVTMHCYVTA